MYPFALSNNIILNSFSTLSQCSHFWRFTTMAWKMRSLSGVCSRCCCSYVVSAYKHLAMIFSCLVTSSCACFFVLLARLIILEFSSPLCLLLVVAKVASAVLIFSNCRFFTVNARWRLGRVLLIVAARWMDVGFRTYVRL